MHNWKPDSTKSKIVRYNDTITTVSNTKYLLSPADITPFKTPLPSPLIDFKLDTTDPKLYRPFRHGQNFITMGIRKMNWNEWIEMDSNFLRYHDRKVLELEKDLSAHVAYVDNAVTRDGCFEMYEELTQYLTHRYPDFYKLENNVLSNSLTGETFRFPAESPTEALATSAKLVQDDLVLMVKNDDGHYHLDAASVCLPGFWRVHEKFRMSLDTLHIEAGVPHYQEKLMKSMNKFFHRLRPEDPVIRNNVSFFQSFRRISLLFNQKEMGPLLIEEYAVLHPTRRRPPLVPPHGRPEQHKRRLLGHGRLYEPENRRHPFPLRAPVAAPAAALRCADVYNSYVL
jgi:hypothetical protein